MLSPACTDVIPSMYWIPSTVLKLSPTVLMLSPIVLNNLHSTEGIPHSTEAIPHMYCCYPPPHMYCCYPPHSTEGIPPQYWCYPPDVLNNLHSTEPTLYGVICQLSQYSGTKFGILFEIAEPVEIHKILGKTDILPWNSWFHINDYYVATFVHINLQKANFSHKLE